MVEKQDDSPILTARVANQGSQASQRALDPAPVGLYPLGAPKRAQSDVDPGPTSQSRVQEGMLLACPIAVHFRVSSTSSVSRGRLIKNKI
jgi:hypothetical protein